MQAETRTLTHLFQLDVRYLIPLYQRPYVWTRDRQWEPLWGDISTVADHVVSDGPSSGSPSHFLGAIVIHQQENPPGTPQQFLVIDGQQRLATLQLLLQAAATCAADLGCVDQAQLIRKLVYNDPLLAKGHDRFKVWPTNANRDAFVCVMDPDGDPSQVEDDPHNEIQEAFAFFAEQVREWATDGEASQDEIEKRLSALRVTLSDLLKLVAIRLEDHDNPQVIFETLNARGTPLIALDLLKNSVFLAAANEAADSDHLYFEHWEPELDRKYWRKDRRQGRLYTKNGDLFLMHWLVVELAKPVPATELFDTFREEILARGDAPAMAALIPRLCADAAVMRGFDEMPEGSPERRFFDLLELLDTTTMLPMALLLFRSPEVTEERRHRALRALEDYLVRRMIWGGTTKNYNRQAAGLIAEMKKDLEAADEVMISSLVADEAPANRWPTDAEVRDVVQKKSLYGSRRQDRLVMVLWEIEERWRAQDAKAEKGLAKPKKLTLEHVIPRSWERSWPLDESVDDPLEWREQHLHRLGNLTLTTGELNSSLSNGPWNKPKKPKDKKRGLVKHSLLKLNKRLADDFPEKFDERSVDNRGELLADEIVAIWPGPKAYETAAASP